MGPCTRDAASAPLNANCWILFRVRRHSLNRSCSGVGISFFPAGLPCFFGAAVPPRLSLLSRPGLLHFSCPSCRPSVSANCIYICRDATLYCRCMLTGPLYTNDILHTACRYRKSKRRDLCHAACFQNITFSLIGTIYLAPKPPLWKRQLSIPYYFWGANQPIWVAPVTASGFMNSMLVVSMDRPV